MDPFATPAELATYMQTATQAQADAGDPDVLDTGVALQALASSSAAIRAVCGWSITEETVTDQAAPWGWWKSDRLFLPTLRLTALSLTVQGVPVPAAAGFFWEPYGVVRLFPRGYGFAVNSPGLWVAPPVMLMTYTHGFPVAPDEVKAVCLERAAAAMSNTERLVSLTVGSVTEVYQSQAQQPGSDALVSDPRLSPFILPALA